MSLLPAPMMSARRRTVLVFHAPEAGAFEAMAITNAGIGLDGFYRPTWAKTETTQAVEDPWQCLRRVVAERDPKCIGIDVAADGINQIAHDVIGEAFSSRVIHPGVTTALDVAWWMRLRVNGLGLTCWFQPTVSIQRRGAQLGDIGSTPDEVIRPGDLLHCDFGLHDLGLATDTQQNAYVLRLGEGSPPAGVARALRVANRQQEGVPGRGDVPLHDDTLHSLEMFVEVDVPEWDGRRVRLASEQIVAFTGENVHYLGGRQTALHLVH